MIRRFLYTLVFFLVSAPLGAHAASLYLSPSSLTLSAGQTGVLTLYVDSSDQAMNAVSGNIRSGSGLSITSVSKAGSVISFWATEPSAISGSLSFEGIAVSPGYTGSGGKILSFTVRAASAGTYSLDFLSGSILANDGLGTDITSGNRGARVVVNEASVPITSTAPDTSGTPSAPKVTSQEFPTPEGWYAHTEGVFSWKMPEGVTSVRTLLDQNKNTIPSILLDGRVGSREVKDIPEGVNYFHVQFKSADGWGAITHYRVAVDTTPPSFTSLSELAREDVTDPVIRMRPVATDEGSGIESFEISVDGGPYAPVTYSGGIIRTPALAPGEHRLSVHALDGAGNASAAREVAVTVKALPAPVITFVTVNPKQGEPIVVSGNSEMKGATAHLVFSKGNSTVDGGTGTVEADGTFSILFSREIAPGGYTVSVYIEDGRGARSLPDTDTVSVAGIGTDAILLLIAQIIGALVAVAAVIGGGMWVLLHLGHTVAKKGNLFMAEIRQADDITKKAFALLRKDVSGYASYLKRQKRTRDLTDEEQEFLSGLTDDLDKSERVIRKELANAAGKAAKKSRSITLEE